VCGSHPNVSCVSVVVVHKKCKYQRDTIGTAKSNARLMILIRVLPNVTELLKS
jgi:hypothetical protein